MTYLLTTDSVSNLELYAHRFAVNCTHSWLGLTHQTAVVLCTCVCMFVCVFLCVRACMHVCAYGSYGGYHCSSLSLVRQVSRFILSLSKRKAHYRFSCMRQLTTSQDGGIGPATYDARTYSDSYSIEVTNCRVKMIWADAINTEQITKSPSWSRITSGRGVLN